MKHGGKDIILKEKNIYYKKFPKVTILILNWNGWKDTIECLESVFRNTYPNYQVIVVDNGSTNGSIEKIKAWADGKQEVLTPESTHPLYHLSHPPVEKPIPYICYDREEAERGGNFKLGEKVTKEWQKQRKAKNKGLNPTSLYPLIFIKTGDNLGYGGGNNVGIRYFMNKIQIKYILVLNNDIVVDRDFILPLIKVAENNSKIGIFGPAIYYYHKYLKPNFLGAKINFWNGTAPHITNYNKKNNVRSFMNSDYQEGSAMLIKRTTFECIGMLDETYFLFWDETDFCHRAKKVGIQTVCILDSKIYHKIRKSFDGIRSKNPILNYYSFRSRILFERKYALFYHWPFFLINIFYSILKTLAISLIRERNSFCKNFNSIIHGVLDGFLIRIGDKIK